MKKIASVLVIGALTLGSVFADVNLAFTGKSVIVGENGNLNLKGYTKDFTGDAKVEDNVKFKVSNDVAGVYFEVKPNAANSSFDGVTLNQYYGWANFGKVKVQMGRWESRSVARMNDEADKWEGNHYEMVKPGINGGKFGSSDVANLTGKSLATQVSVNAGSFNGSLAIVNKKDAFIINDGSDFDGKTGFKLNAGFAFEGNFKIDASKVTVVFKNLKQDEIALAGFFSTKVENKQIMAGFTYAMDKADKQWGVDFRAKMPFGDKATLTTMNNLSYLSATSMKLWDMVSVSMPVNDTIKMMGTVEFQLPLIGGTDADRIIRVIPSVKIMPANKCYLTSGLVIDITGFHFFGDNKDLAQSCKFAVPLILHVEL